MKHGRNWPHRALAAGLLGLAAGSALAGGACTQVPLQADGHYDFPSYLKPAPGAYGRWMWQSRGLCYADGAAWIERKYGTDQDTAYDQRFEMYRSSALPKRQALPLILWAHPSGPTQIMIEGNAPPGETSPLMEKLVVPAVNAGFAFMSVQFRHPRASQSVDPRKFDPQVPHTDIAEAVQWVRSRAADLGVDPDNIFLLGQSRGSLALLNAFLPDLRDRSRADWRAESSKPRAVFVAQAQTTYEHAALRDGFILPTATVPVPPLTQPGFDYRAYLDRNDPAFIDPGSALAALDLGDPPFWMRYERAPTDHGNLAVVPLGSRVAAEGRDPMKEGVCYEPAAADYPLLADSGCFDEHHPNFGAALAARFLALQPTAEQRRAVGIQYGPRQATQRQLDKVSAQFYDHYTCFFIQNLTPAGAVLRAQAVPEALSPSCRITDWPWPPKP
ncbi:hypothetical protein QRD43_06945 [Pelomonas sp. APW6]|uniref:BD-FAE-like domain-containing protein n=1 Tax=Roseateles subflavus TaxID=3053353 RepID=A0ABT7LFM3_9BURK|nr:hypothetical protein [Pelomonas sp. APW6]MDL5031642.1 hypothetical protein [Pelomonas sp. APW6]